MLASRCLMLTLLAAASLAGQGIRAGAVLGVPFTKYFETGSAGGQGSAEYSAATRRYTGGASVEWQWRKAFGVELDVLYHRMGYVAIVNTVSSASGAFANSAIDVKGNSWDFPLLVKYRFGRAAKPFLAGGGVLRHAGPVRGRGQQTTGSLVSETRSTIALDTAEPSELRKRNYLGVTAVGGFELGGGRVRILPELRYTRWTSNIAGPGGLLRFAPNQAEFLVGVTF
jgi:hypothetical protein